MENEILFDNILLGKEINDFCGITFKDIDSFNIFPRTRELVLYIAGNIGEVLQKINLTKIKQIYVIKNYSTNYEETHNLIEIGEVPINIHGVGIYFRQFFDRDYYNLITQNHDFQFLTESNKSGHAMRKGIYITPVSDDYKFKLLRCSSNFDGPTDNFRQVDYDIVNKANSISRFFFKNQVEMNHVLAQIYTNSKHTEKKAKIKAHSDKTKDMPKDGIMAFCTFYQKDELSKPFLKQKQYDYLYKNGTALTTLRFRLKDKKLNLKSKFDVVLYPNSMFLMPLSTNRLYTHKIVPPSIPIENIPTRMGYVIRCSNTEAIFRDKTYIKVNENYIELAKPNQNDIDKLKELYYKENMTTEIVHYNNIFFSLNNGDYMKPIL